MARGDHLYYFRAGGTYSHHGIDCGDGNVIHYASSPWMKLAGCLTSDEQPKVAKTSFEEFAQGSEAFVREYNAETKLDDVETAMGRAESRIGEECYSIFGNNCEHFIVWCKTGVSDSSQVNAHRRAADAVIKGAPVGAFLLRAARKVPGPYRSVATLGAIGIAGAVYLGTYLQHRFSHMQSGHS
jgi:hypothetical protein